jgi:hypothetical protein
MGRAASDSGFKHHRRWQDFCFTLTVAGGSFKPEATGTDASAGSIGLGELIQSADAFLSWLSNAHQWAEYVRTRKSKLGVPTAYTFPPSAVIPLISNIYWSGSTS